jgi:glucan phosphoethanolaminetransferase (alkaline phosphatase superfamily)
MSSDEHGPRPSLRPTAPSTLAVVGLAGAALTLLLAARYYQHFPDLSVYNSLVLFALAALLAWMAWTTRKTLRPSRRQTQAASAGGLPSRASGGLEGPEHALQIARFAVLAKAAAIAGAAFFGAYLGFTVWLAVQSGRLTAAAEDLTPAVLGTIACAALTAAALWLEHSCRIPPQEEEPRGEDSREPNRP